MRPRLAGVRLFLALLVSSFWFSSAYAAPIGGGGIVGGGGGSVGTVPIGPGGGGGGGIDPQLLSCISRTIAATTFTATPNPVMLNSTATLTWSVNVPADCQTMLTYLLLNNTPVAFAGSMSVKPMSNTDYYLQTVAGRGVVNFGHLVLNVQLPSEVHIKGNTADWKALLKQALGTERTTIYLASNVDMDLSGEIGIPIVEGVSVIGGEPCSPVAKQAPASVSGAAVGSVSTAVISSFSFVNICGGRTPQTFGPRLYTSSRPDGLLSIPCDWGFVGDVHLEGFRIQGPHWGSEDGDDNLEKGIVISGCRNVDIGNMELSGFSGAAVYATDDTYRAQVPDAVKVHDSFIHHNQHIGGNGYGVDASHGSFALVERNVFDFNRHAITAGSVVGNPGYGGYTANYNLVLKGGGYHGKWYETYTQQFDVHGDNNCVDGLPSWLTPSGIWNCGRSGKEYHVNFNAFQYSNGLDFKLRGTPSVGAFIDNNVFPQNTSNEVQTGGWGTIGLYIGPNKAPLDSFGNYGVCDFDGDGHDDLFLSTGVSWWYMSSAKRQWTYLNSYTDTIDHLAFGDFDGNGGCDVFAVHGNDWVISRGGRGPWQSLGSFGVPFDQLRFGHFTGGPRTEIFRRAPDGQWWLISPGVFGWTPLQSSGVPLSQLHFGNFGGHGVTDVIAAQNGQWSVSYGGRTPWQPLNPGLSDSLDHILIADLDGKGTDDIIRYNSSAGAFEVSVGGRSGWQRLASAGVLDIAGGVFTGHFQGLKPAEIFTIGPAAFPFVSDDNVLRKGHLYSRAAGAFTPYGIYSY